MNWNRIRVESIEDDQTVMVVGRVLQLKPCIAQNDFCLCTCALLQVSKIVSSLRDVDNSGIDFVERPMLILKCVTRHRAGAEADNTNVRRGSVRVECRKDLSERTIAMKV